MSHDLVRASMIVLMVAAGSATAWAQAAPPPSPESLGSPQQEREADKSLQTPVKSGREEPSSHTPTEPPTDTTVLRDGALVVPGAPQDTETVPAKHSARNDADDKLIILAHTFKTLPDDQRQAIFQALKDEPPVANLNAEIGTVVPYTVAVDVVPDRLTAKVPAAQGFHFAVSDHRVLLIAPVHRAVVGVFTGTGDATTGKGDRVH